jgi:hypothetical protein
MGFRAGRVKAARRSKINYPENVVLRLARSTGVVPIQMSAITPDKRS